MKLFFLKYLILGFLSILFLISKVSAFNSISTITLEVIRVEDPRLDALDESDIKEVFAEAQRVISVKLGDNIHFSFHDNGRVTSEQFFQTVHYYNNPIYISLSKFKYPIYGEPPPFNYQKEAIITFLKAWKLSDIAKFFPGDAVKTYDDAYALTVSAYMKNIERLKNIQLADGSHLLLKDDRPHQSFLNWTALIYSQDKYDVIITNSLIAYDIFVEPYPHVVALHAKVGGGALKSPKREILGGQCILLNSISETGNIKELGDENIHVGKSTRNRIVGGFVFAHEFAHAYYHIPDVYDHGDSCLFSESQENSSHRKGYEMLMKNNDACPRCEPYVIAKKYALLGQQSLEKKNIRAAGDLFLKAAELTPSVSAYRMEYLNTLYGKALSCYTSLNDPEKIYEVSILKSETEYGLGNFGEARDLLQKSSAIRKLGKEPARWLSSLNYEIGGRENYKSFDDLNEINGWVKYPEPGTTMAISSTNDPARTMKIEYDLKSRSWIQFYKVYDAKLPIDGVFKFKLKWQGQRNNFEFKVVDRGNTNYRKIFEFPGNSGEWQDVSIPVSDLKYWQYGDGILNMDHIRALWLAVSKGTGGKGQIEICDFKLVRENKITYTEPSGQ